MSTRSRGSQREWHHIVEQSQLGRSGFSKSLINSDENLIAVPMGVHRQISRFYSSYLPGTRTLVRDYLAGKSYDFQYRFGVDIMRKAFQGQLK